MHDQTQRGRGWPKMHKPPTADTRSSEFKTFGASILDDQIDGLTVTLDPEADEICVIAETTHYGTCRVR